MTLRPLAALAVVLLPLSPLSAEDSRGKVLYNQLCFTCHGAHLEGGIGPALKDAYWRHGDSPEAILKAITKGIDGSEMIAYEQVYSEEDRIALRDFIVDEQEGLRSLVRSYYPRNYLTGKRLTPEVFNSIESTAQTPIPENTLWTDNNLQSAVRFTAKLHIVEAGSYQFKLRSKGRTAVFLDGEEIYYFNEKQPKEKHINKAATLKAGVYAVEIFHESPPVHGWMISGSLSRNGGKEIQLHGRSLQGNIPRFILAGSEAKVIRKWIKGISPRTLLCLLPNKVIVAFNPDTGQVESAWKEARVNQTPSLPDRSASPSQIEGTPLPPQGSLPNDLSIQHRAYQTDGANVVIHSEVNGEPRVTTISPQGEHGYQIR